MYAVASCLQKSYEAVRVNSRVPMGMGKIGRQIAEEAYESQQ